MKKYLPASFAAALLLVFVACSDIADSGSQSAENSESATNSSVDSSAAGSSAATATSSADETQSESCSSDIIEVSSSAKTLTLSGLSIGQSIFMIRTNPTASAISSGYTRSVSSASGLSTASGTVTSSSSSGGSSGVPTPWSHGGPRHCLTASLNTAFDVSLALDSCRAAASSLSAATLVEPVVNETTKKIYVDTDSDISTFKSKTATLRAIGSYCYVWVVGGASDRTYWTDSSSLSDGGEQINAEIAQRIAGNFDRLYPMVRNVFGDESDELIYNNKRYAMETYSDTGTMVNIVVYDIGADYNSESGGDTVGYFYAKDYYKGASSASSSELRYSNGGKYFYIDAYYAANYTSMVYSTLAHEFQHMVDWGVKYMEQGLSTSTWFNEMLSMLCEDMMKEYIKESDADFTDDDSPLSRLPMFNCHYYDTGLEYRTTGTYDVYYSYANNYAFGAWLMRNYGGIDLLNALSTNEYVDVASITAATGETMANLLRAYGWACLIDESGTGFNIAVSGAAYDGYCYPLDAIDLWSLEESLPDLYTKYAESKDYSSYYSFDGPVYFGYDEQAEIRPYGFTLSKIGTATDSEVTLNFNTANVSSSQKVYIVIN